MADARTLLRQQQATRRITSPHALYSSTGRLSCTLCRESVKTEALWDAHARSAPHRTALHSHAARPAPPTAGTKRKLEDEDEEEGDSPDDDGARRKRSRADAAPPVLTPASSASGSRASNTPSHGVELSIPSRPATPKTAAPNPLEARAGKAATAQGGPVDEAEWAAFEADIAAATAPYSEDAVISAPAVPAGGEQGGESQGEGEGRRGPRDVEIEAEREDAKRALEDEFDEMEELEARAKRLKERREALRARTSTVDLKSEGAGAAKGVDKENARVEEEEEEESEEEEDDYAWGGLRYSGRV